MTALTLLVSAVVTAPTMRPAAAVIADGSCAITPTGDIAVRWALLDGKGGPLGCPTGRERDVPGRNGRIQDFQHGQVVWSPGQGGHLTVAAYQRGRSAVVEWGDAAPYHYEFFLVRWDSGGRNLGQQPALFGTPTSGAHPINPDHNADYTFVVEGCDKPRYGSSQCRQGWTIPVTVHFFVEGRTHDGVPPGCSIGTTGDISAKWQGLGAEHGPLGCPTAPQHQVPGRRGGAQSFEHGEIVASPDQGTRLTVAAYLLGNRVAVDWGPTDPFHYDFFQVRRDRDGVHQEQTEIRRHPGITAARYTARLQGYGTYGFVVQGCDDGGFLSGAKCRQGWTIPVHVRLAADPGHRACPLGASGPIGDRWQELRGSAGFLGCPAAAQEAPRGRHGARRRFANGEVALSTDQGRTMVVAAYQEADQAVVEWGPTDPFSYDHFVVRWDGNGRNLGQQDVTGSRTSGRLRVGFPAGGGPVTFTVEGCDKGGFLRHSSCRQGWTIPVTVTPHPVVGASVQVPKEATARTPAEARATDAARLAAVVGPYACHSPVDLDTTQPGEDEAMLMVARLEQVRSRGESDACPGDLPNRILVNEVLRDIQPKDVGTSSDDCPLHKVDGDYDTFLKGLVRIAYTDGRLLDIDVRERLLDTLLTMRGAHSAAQEGKLICGFTSPESENHLLLIESARYLTNQLMFDRTQDATFDNHVNGMDAYLLRFMRNIAQHDFLEFNARPYQRYSLHALLNLHDFARQPRVRTGARIVLDFATTKFATSSSMLRRSGPYRRLDERSDFANRNYYSNGSDPQTLFFLFYTGLTVNTDGWIPGEESVIAGLSGYRPPQAAYEVAMNKGTPYQQRFFGGPRPRIHPDANEADPNVEIYSSSPSYMITAGGVFLNSGYRAEEIIGRKNRGVAQATTLMPTRANLEYADLIRFEGQSRTSSPFDRDVVNTCVAGGFACGIRGVISARWLRCVGPESNGDWLLLDLERCGGLGLYVALHVNKDAPGSARPFDNSGFFYAAEASTPFSAFVTETKSRNTALPRSLNVNTPYTFNAPDGHTYRFQIYRNGDKYLSRVLAVDGTAQPDSARSWPLADGPFLSSTAHDGLIKIRRPGCANALVLDFRDEFFPTRTEPATPDPAPCPDQG